MPDALLKKKISKEQAFKLGIPKNNIHTILFSKNDYTLKQSRDWLKKHNYKYKNYRLEGEHRRFMQEPAILNADYYGKKITPQITFIFQSY
jgi:hypothetical protein